MRWEIERYVRLYRRDTPEWSLIPWRAKGLFDELLRKCDLDGRIECGRLSPAQAAAIAVGAPAADVPEVEQLLAVLIADGCVLDVSATGRRGRHLLLPNYRDAQGIAMTGAERTAKWREEQEKATQTPSSDESDGHRHKRHAAPNGAPKTRNGKAGESQAESPQADECDAVTDPAEPSRAEPNQPNQPSQQKQQPTTARSNGVGPDPLAVFRERLADRLAIMSSNPLPVARLERARPLRQHIERLGVDHAIELCTERVVTAGRAPPRFADYFLDFLAEQPTPIDRAPGENPRPGDPDFNDPAAWRDYGDFLKRTDGRSAEEALGFKPPKYVPPKTPEEEAEERARAAAAKGASA